MGRRRQTKWQKAVCRKFRHLSRRERQGIKHLPTVRGWIQGGAAAPPCVAFKRRGSCKEGEGKSKSLSLFVIFWSFSFIRKGQKKARLSKRTTPAVGKQTNEKQKPPQAKNEFPPHHFVRGGVSPFSLLQFRFFRRKM